MFSFGLTKLPSRTASVLQVSNCRFTTPVGVGQRSVSGIEPAPGDQTWFSSWGANPPTKDWSPSMTTSTSLVDSFGSPWSGPAGRGGESDPISRPYQKLLKGRTRFELATLRLRASCTSSCASGPLRSTCFSIRRAHSDMAIRQSPYRVPHRDVPRGTRTPGVPLAKRELYRTELWALERFRERNRGSRVCTLIAATLSVWTPAFRTARE